MANRLVIGAFDGKSRVRISKPGRDVLDPALRSDRIAFDSTWFDGALVYASQNIHQGQVVFNWPDLSYPPVMLAFNNQGVNIRTRYNIPEDAYCPAFVGDDGDPQVEYRYDRTKLDFGTMTLSGFRSQVLILANPLSVLPGNGLPGNSQWMLGERFGKTGVWVAKPGYDVLTCALEEMSFAPSYPTLQVIDSGTINITGSTGGGISRTLTHPDYGYNPLTLVTVQGEPAATDRQPQVVGFARHTNRTTTVLYVRAYGYKKDGAAYDLSELNLGDISWIRFNFPSRNWLSNS